MAEINALPWNGLKVASTFSGTGGSCLGYRMAGFKVVWANEFVPVAQDSYKANAAPDCILDRRDIHQVQASEILEATKLAAGELDLFDGSPPCQAFSTAGKGSKGWGQKKQYEHGASQCNEMLFAEYIRLLRGLQPKTFVAENVSGLVKGTAKGMFLEILGELRASGYKVKCQVLDAKWLGVPQSRPRTIFVGVRNDLPHEPAHPKPLPYQYTIRDAIPWILSARSGPSGFSAGSVHADKPAPSITASLQSPWGAHEVEAKPFNRAVHDTGGAYSSGDVTDRPSPTVLASNQALYAEKDSSLDGFAIGTEWDKLKKGQASSKYFSLIKTDPDKPNRSILASHGHPGTAGVTHPIERRKFSILELKRICGFPDDFVLVGKYAQQWERLGNSVPPVMMRHIAETIRDQILLKLS